MHFGSHMHAGYSSFLAPYTSSLKMPDCALELRGARRPTIDLESGYSESKPKLYEDRDLWLLGGRGDVQAWSKITASRVKVVIELWDLDAV